MDHVNGAMEALKQVVLKEKKNKELAERVDSLTTTLRLLDISLGSGSQIFEKLVAAVREPFIPLYKKFPLQAFQLSAAIFSFLFHEKIEMHLTAGNKVLQSSWEDVAESLLSGVLDFLETRSDSATLRTLASALYPTLCRICFSPTFYSSITMGSALRYTAFTLLVDSANEPANKEMLRDPEYLGSRRLGDTLYRSKDYVILENLLLLTLIVAPKSESMDKRGAFMREVFVTNYPEDSMYGEDLAKILTKPTEKDSDLLQAQVIDILAKGNLMFPQPFGITQIDSCGLRFPQKPPQQRLIVDYKSLLANVIKDEGYESFRVSFDQICGLAFSAVDKKSLTRVVMHLSSAPTIQSQPIRVPDGQSPSMTFEVRESDVYRFKRALRSRGVKEGAPHISVSQGGPRLEFDREGNPVPEVLAPERKVQTIERVMQLSQRSDDPPKDMEDQNHEHHLPANEQQISPVVRSSRTLVGIAREAAIVTSSGSGTTPSGALPGLLASHRTQTTTEPTTAPLDAKFLADVTPRLKAPHRSSVLVPATPAQNKILHKDAFGSGDTDLSELSGSEVDSMKVLSQKIAARTDSMIAITKRASVLADIVTPAGASRKKAVERRVLDSDDEEALSNSRKRVKGNSKPSAGNTKKALPVVVVTNVEDDEPLPPFKRRPKPTKKNTDVLDEGSKPLRNKGTPKRKRANDDDDDKAVGISDIRDKTPPAKRARKTASGKPGTTKPKVVFPAPIPTPPRDSQVLKKVRPAAGKNANYGGRTKAARPSPARNSPALSDDDDLPDVLELKTCPVDPSLVDDDGDDDYASSPPAAPKPKSKSKAAVKPKSMLTEKAHPLEKSKTTATKTRAKTQTGTRTRAAATKAKDAGDVKATKAGPLQKTKAKTKKKAVALSADEERDEGGKEERGKVDLTKGSPTVIEVLSSPSGPPKVILPKHKPISRVTSKEECAVVDQPRNENPTKVRSAPKKVVLPQGEEDSRIEEVAMEAVEVIIAPAPPPVRSSSPKTRAKVPAKPISEQAFATSVEWKRDNYTSYPTEVERPPVVESQTTNNSRLVEANPPAVSFGVVDHEIEVEVEVKKEAVATGAQDVHPMDVEPYISDPIVAKSPMKLQVDGITEAAAVYIRELPESEELRPLETNPEDGQSSEVGVVRGFTPPQPIMNRMPVGISAPKERLEITAGTEVAAQPTPATLPRGRQRAGQVTFRKPKVTFATSPFEKETVRPAQNETTPRSGAQRRTIFEGDVFGANNAWKRSPAKSSEKHTALIEILSEIQDVIVEKITHQFEVVEEEAQFARNDVHNEALTDFKEMHSQRAVQFNALVDLETAYATREKALVAAYETTLAVNAEILGHVRQKIREHDERNFVGGLPKTLRKKPMSALMNSYLK